VLVDRLLAVASDLDASGCAQKIGALRQFLLLHGAVRSWLWVTLVPAGDPVLDGSLLPVTAAVLSVAFALSLVPSVAFIGPRVAVPALLLQLAVTFPLTDNHFFIELLAVTLLSIVGSNAARDSVLALRGLLWMTALIFFHTGLQKVLYGHYLHGDFIAFMIGRGGRFADLFAFLLPTDAIARLQSYNPVLTGAGPYRVAAPLLVAVSNLIYAMEMILPPLFMVRSTRTAAAGTAILLVAAIEFGAREMAFGLLFTNLLLLFLPGPWNRRLFPFLAVLYLWALGAGLGILPGESFITPTIL
jgi:hypothetical protein